MDSTSFQKLFFDIDVKCGLTRPMIPIVEDPREYDSQISSNNNQIAYNKKDLEKLKLMTQRIAVQNHRRVSSGISEKLPEISKLFVGVYDPRIIQELRKKEREELMQLKDQNFDSMNNDFKTINRNNLPDWEVEIYELMRENNDNSETNKKLNKKDEQEYDSDDVDAKLKEKGRKKQRESIIKSVNSKAKNTSTHFGSMISQDFSKRFIGPVSRATLHIFNPEIYDLDTEEDPLDTVILNDNGVHDHDDLWKTSLVKSSHPKDDSESLKMVRNKLFNRYHFRHSREAIDLTALDDETMAAKFEMEKLRKLEKANRIRNVEVPIDTTESLIKSAIKRSRDSYNRANQSGGPIAALAHANVANTHHNTRADLSEQELKNFHRPRITQKDLNRSWRITVSKKPVAEKKDSTGKPASTSSNITLSDKNASLLKGKDVKFMVLEYVEEFPPLMLNYGMASVMYNYFQSSSENINEEHDANNANKLKSKDTLVAKSNRLAKVSKTLEEKNCRLPKHVLMLLSLKNYRRPYEFDASIPKLVLGQTKVLSSADQSPFLGSIATGEVQPSIQNNLFQAPLFQHHVPVTDFLLIRSKVLPMPTASENHEPSFLYTLKEIPFLYIAGQIEPQKIVPRPTNRMTGTQEKFYLLAIARHLQQHRQHGCDYHDLQRSILKYCLKEQVTPHKASHRNKWKELVKKVGDELSHHGSRWFPKHFQDPDQAHQFSTNTLAKSFTPEEVCQQESCNAAEYRLFQQQITDVDLGKIRAFLSFCGVLKKHYEQRRDAVQRFVREELAIMHPRWQVYAKKFVSIVNSEIQRINERVSIARYLMDALVRAPWNTTEAFVKAIIEKDNTCKLAIQAIGDPSGRGEGFAFVRASYLAVSGDQQEQLSSQKKKEMLQLVGTDKDLRKLTKTDAIRLLVSLGVRQEQAAALQRWDRIHMIREWITKLHKKGVLPKDLEKYVRDESMIGGHKLTDDWIEQLKASCEQIWIRQKMALAKYQPPALDGGLDDDDDDDDDLIDLGAGRSNKNQELLDNDRTRVNFDNLLAPKNSNISTVKKRTQLLGSAGQSTAASNSVSQSSVATTENTTSENAQSKEQMHDDAEVTMSRSYPPRVVKRITRVNKLDGTEEIKVEFIFHQEEIQRVKENLEEAARERELRKFATIFNEKMHLKRGKSAGSYLSGSNFNYYQDHEEDEVTATTAKMTINFTKMKKLATDHQEKQQLQEMKNKLANRNRDRDSMKAGKRTAMDDDDLDENFNAIKPSKKRSLGPVINQRIPKVTLAGKLEKELLLLYQAKGAQVFVDPVNRTLYPDYYERITHPICLNEIREKIARLEYETAEAMLDDLRLMAHNAEVYNGTNHQVYQTAKRMLDSIVTSIQNEKRTFGFESNIYTLAEDAIRRKNSVARSSIF